MANINNKNLISFTLALLTTLLFVIFLIPKDTHANFQQPNCAISNFSAIPNYITSGGSSNLNWNTNNCNSVSISSIGNVNTGGNQVVYPNSTTTYILTAYGANGNQVTQSKTITVEKLNCEISSFYANPNYINSTESSTLNWDTNNCNTVSITNIGNVNSSGSQTIYPNSTTKYILTAYGANGEITSRTKTITVAKQNCIIENFNANTTSINYGSSSTLNWNTANCTSVNISNIGSVNSSGNKTVYPNSTTTYILSAYGANGNQITQSRTVKVTKKIVASFFKNPNNNTTNNNTTNNTTNNNNSNSNTNQTTNNENNENQVSSLAGNALFGSNGFLPSSLFGWLFFIILILIAVILWRKLYISDKERQAPLKHA